MPEAWMIKKRRTARYNKSMEMRLIRKDAEIALRCGDMDFILYGI